VKRLTILFTLGAAALAAACSGGGGNSTPPPPTGGFTPASLKGNYAFSMSGEDPFQGTFLTRVGSFVADGNGSITSAIEDVGDGVQPTTVTFSQGTYTIQANGKGTITLPAAVGGGLLLSFSMSSAAPNGGGLLIQADGNATSSGSFNQQHLSSFTQPFAAANYIFDFTGTDLANGFPVSIVGEVATNGAGSVGTGTEDVNDGGAAAPSGPLTIVAGGSVTPDNSAGNNANFGRSTITFGGNTFALYPIDQTHAKFIEIDGAALTSGDSFEQTGTIPTKQNFTSSFIFLTGGSNVNPNVLGAVTRAARFTPDGNGNLNTLLFDQNVQKSDGTGSHSCVDSSDGGCSLSVMAATYSITGSASPGRGTLSITLNSQSAAVDDVFYIASPTLGVIQDVSLNIVADGSMLGQAGNIATSGNFVVNLTGQVAPSSGNVGGEEDIVGQYALSSGSVSGASDLIELGSTSNHNISPTDVATSGTSQTNGDGTKRNSLQLVFTPTSGPAAKRNFIAYVGGSPPQLMLIGTDTADIDVGTVLTQTTPQ
jgi:hypothetical protein